MQKLVAGDVDAVILTENDWSVGTVTERHALNRVVNAHLTERNSRHEHNDCAYPGR